MTVFDDSQKDELGTWFPYFTSRIDPKSGTPIFDDPEPGAARFRIRSAVPFYRARQSERKLVSEFVLNPEKKSMERVSYYEDQTPEQDQKEREDLHDYLITDIVGASWEDGRPIECTRENKLKLFAKPVFDRFVAKCLDMISGTTAPLEKN